MRSLPVPVLLGITMFFWGAAFNITDVALEYTTPGIVAAARALIAAAVLIAILPFLKSHLPRDRRTWYWALVTGAGATTLSLAGMSEGIARAGPAVAAVLLNTAPFWAAIMAWVVLSERVSALRALGLVVGFSGVVLMVVASGSEVAGGSGVYLGAALTIVGAIGYAMAGVIMRWLHTTGFSYDLYGFTAAQFVCGGVLLLPYAMLAGDPGSTDWSSGQLWMALLALALGAQIISFLTFYSALERWTSARVMAWSFLPPVIAVAIEALRGNPPGALTAVGMAVVVFGIIIVNLPRAEVPA